jgi:ribosomal protein L16/L10AE
MTVSVNPANFTLAKKSLKSAGQKLPTAVRFVIDKGQDQVPNN